MQHLQYGIKSSLNFTIALPLLPLKSFLKHHIPRYLHHTIFPTLATARASYSALVTDYVHVIDANIEWNLNERTTCIQQLFNGP